MPLLDSAAGLGPVLERDRLHAPILAQDLRADGRVLDDGLAYGRLVSVHDQQHAVEVDLLAGLGIQQLNLELGSEFDAVLLAAGLDDCVHGSSGVGRGEAAPRCA